MPIYEYRCSSCGHEKEVLQKMSEAPLTMCPACGKETFSKLISAAGFQLKGSGWYVTDFRGGSKGDGKKGEDKKGDDTGKSAAKPDAAAPSESKPKEEAKAEAPATGGSTSSSA